MKRKNKNILIGSILSVCMLLTLPIIPAENSERHKESTEPIIQILPRFEILIGIINNVRRANDYMRAYDAILVLSIYFGSIHWHFGAPWGLQVNFYRDETLYIEDSKFSGIFTDHFIYGFCVYT